MAEYNETDDDYLNDGFPKDFDLKRHKILGNNGSLKQDGTMDDYTIEQLRKITSAKTKPIYQCIGQMLMDFGDGCRSMTGGTGTVIKKLPNHHFLVLTCAHNLVKYDKITKKAIEPAKLWFLPKGSAQHSCRLQLVDREIYDKYKPENDLCPHDLALVLFHDKKGSKGQASQHYDVIKVQDVVQIGNWTDNEDPTLNLYGYPCKSEEGLLLGMMGEAELQSDRGLWVYDEIYTYPGQSGSAIWKRIKQKTFQIYGIHIFGDTEKQQNCGIYLDAQKREWIQKVMTQFDSVASDGSNSKDHKVRIWLKDTVCLQENAIDTLIREGYDNMMAIKCLKDKDLQEIGIKRGHIKQIIRYVDQLEPINYDSKGDLSMDAKLWLKNIICLDERDINVLIDNGYDNMVAMQSLDDGELNDIGIKRGHIKQIMYHVQILPMKVYRRPKDDNSDDDVGGVSRNEDTKEKEQDLDELKDELKEENVDYTQKRDNTQKKLKVPVPPNIQIKQIQSESALVMIEPNHSFMLQFMSNEGIVMLQFMSKDEKTDWSSIVVKHGVTNYTMKSLKQNTNYLVRCAAKNDSGWSKYSKTFAFKTKKRGFKQKLGIEKVPPPPQIEMKQIEAQSALLLIKMSEESTEYTLEYRIYESDNEKTNWVFIPMLTADWIWIKSLKQSTKYLVRCASKNDIGWSKYSKTVTFITKEKTNINETIFSFKQENYNRIKDNGLRMQNTFNNYKYQTTLFGSFLNEETSLKYSFELKLVKETRNDFVGIGFVTPKFNQFSADRNKRLKQNSFFHYGNSWISYDTNVFKCQEQPDESENNRAYFRNIGDSVVIGVDMAAKIGTLNGLTIKLPDTVCIAITSCWKHEIMVVKH